MAVWRIRSLHLLTTEARYLIWRMAYGVVWEPVYGMLRHLASPEPWALTACCSVYTTMHAGACYLTARSKFFGLEHLCDWISCSRLTATYNGYPLLWMGHQGIRPRQSTAHSVAPQAPTKLGKRGGEANPIYVVYTYLFVIC